MFTYKQYSGHALGLMHSGKEDALMQPEYPENAFSYKNLQIDDIRALNMLYSGMLMLFDYINGFSVDF
jgi:hypothetical protein